MVWYVLFAVLALAALGVLGAWVAIQKDRDPAEGLVLGLLFGPLGVIVEGLLPDGPAEETEEETEEESPAVLRPISPRSWPESPPGPEPEREPPPAVIEDLDL